MCSSSAREQGGEEGERSEVVCLPDHQRYFSIIDSLSHRAQEISDQKTTGRTQYHLRRGYQCPSLTHASTDTFTNHTNRQDPLRRRLLHRAGVRRLLDRAGIPRHGRRAVDFAAGLRPAVR